MKAKINFYIKSWAGLEKKFPDPTEKELTLSKGDRLSSGDFGGFPGSGFIISAPSFEIADITSDEIEIITNGLVEPNPGGGINLHKASHGITHRIELGKSVKLVTQSMDSGFSVTITPQEIVND